MQTSPRIPHPFHCSYGETMGGTKREQAGVHGVVSDKRQNHLLAGVWWNMKNKHLQDMVVSCENFHLNILFAELYM